MIAASFSGWDGVMLVAIFLLLCASGFFALAETALVRTSRQRAEGLRQSGEVKARQVDALVGLVEHPDRFFNPLLLMLLGSQLLAATLLGVLADRWFGPWGVAIASAFEVVVVFVFFEAVPKNFALRHSDRAALGSARTVRFLLALPPVRWAATSLVWLADRVLGGAGAADRAASVSEHELLAMATVAAEEEVIEAEEREIIHSVIEFTDTVVREIMVPRPDVVTVLPTATVAEALEAALAEGLTRLPVYDEEEDDILGVAILKDLASAERDGRGDELVTGVARPPHFVPETMKLQALLNLMRTKRTHLAVAVDEYGSTAGIATMEDVLEELVGEIADEHDPEEEDAVQLRSATSVRVSGRLDLDDLEDLDQTGQLKLPQDSWETVAGLMMDLAEGVPEEGASFEVEGLSFTVAEVDGRKVVWVDVVSNEPIFPEPKPEEPRRPS